ncbi:MAG: type II secretion system F family protein [Candidatus Wallbacteria bacterium]|nr:type II secretion system F family protein [Candidatus Wallbacteria bacterium]
MPLYVYRLAGADGRTEQGEIEGTDPLELRARLESAGGVVLSIRRALAVPRLQVRASDEELALWAGELSLLLKAGVPMVEALGMAGHSRGGLASIVPQMAQSVREGRSLSQSVAAHGEMFGPAFVAGLQAAERGGDLPAALARMAGHFDRRRLLADRVRAALLYPAVLAGLATAVLAFLIGYVVPSFAGVLADSHARLPLITRAVLALAAGFREYLGALAMACVGLGALAALASRRPGATLAMDRWICRLPWVGSTVVRAATARWAEALGMLADGAVPLAEALPLAARAAGNAWMVERLAELGGELEQGTSLVSAAARTGVFDDRTLRMIRVGIESGELPRLLGELARLEGQAVQGRLEAATRLLEPALMAVMGVAVALVLVAMFLPIVELAATL